MSLDPNAINLIQGFIITAWLMLTNFRHSDLKRRMDVLEVQQRILSRDER